jgi:hypothetical protein
MILEKAGRVGMIQIEMFIVVQGGRNVEASIREAMDCGLTGVCSCRMLHKRGEWIGWIGCWHRLTLPRLVR